MLLRISHTSTYTYTVVCSLQSAICNLHLPPHVVIPPPTCISSLFVHSNRLHLYPCSENRFSQSRPMRLQSPVYLERPKSCFLLAFSPLVGCLLSVNSGEQCHVCRNLIEPSKLKLLSRTCDVYFCVSLSYMLSYSFQYPQISLQTQNIPTETSRSPRPRLVSIIERTPLPSPLFSQDPASCHLPPKHNISVLPFHRAAIFPSSRSDPMPSHNVQPKHDLSIRHLTEKPTSCASVMNDSSPPSQYVIALFFKTYQQASDRMSHNGWLNMLACAFVVTTLGSELAS